jgi:HlyD family secretion protein
MRNDLEQRQTLALIDNQLQILEPQYRRQKQLFEKKLIAKQEFERTEADYHYNQERRRITYEVYRNDSIDRIRQLKFTAESEQKMMLSLNGLSKILDNLVIRSPIDGQLSTPHWEIGQNVLTGQRMGQVDVIGSYKVRVPIDELYLPKISAGLPATTDFAGRTYNLSITYIYPTITNGRFEVDMDFVGETPQGIRRGQSLRLRIELGQPSEELLLPIGGFYKDTGGSWVFILDGEDKAIKRNIKLGRKMGSEFFEVLEGLKPGDRVITSSYENFGNNEVLLLN